MVKRVRTKIVATIGPASNNQTVLRKMILFGLDIVRLNFSHSNWQEHSKTVLLVRALNRKLRRAIKIMQDLEGFRLRIGYLNNPLPLKKNSFIWLVKERDYKHSDKSTQLIPFDYIGDLSSWKKKKDLKIFIDDGKIVLEVKAVYKQSLKAKVIIPGILHSRKGINIPGVDLDFDSLTEKDKKDLEFAKKEKVDYIAQSFVRNAEDIEKLRSLLAKDSKKIKIYAKIENQQSLKNLEEILQVADGIIVARGDLGICVPLYHVPMVQKDIIKRANKYQKPVIVATQMLDSMTTEPNPTRAEVTDVANAIFDGANGVLLSAETAIGVNPSRVVEMMNLIIKYAELYQIKGHSEFLK